MPVCIALVAVLGWGVAGLVPASALLLGAVLAPTDPVLASEVQVGAPSKVGDGDEDEVRFALTSEAGLNDGLAFPFVYDKIHGKEIEIYPVEPKACPTLTRAPFAYDHGDTAGYTPLLPMHSLGHAFVPPPIHAGGLRYHGMAPTVSQLINEGLLTPKSVGQMAAYEAAVLWARTEGFIPAPETSNALAQVVEEARKAKEEGKEKTIVVNFSGHGLLDLGAYDPAFAYEVGAIVRAGIDRMYGKDSRENGGELDPDVMLIGFARRAATYKRATLLLRERLTRP